MLCASVLLLVGGTADVFTSFIMSDYSLAFGSEVSRLHIHSQDLGRRMDSLARGSFPQYDGVYHPLLAFVSLNLIARFF